MYRAHERIGGCGKGQIALRALVTGGIGFIGSHLVDALLRRGDEVVCLNRRQVQHSRPGLDCRIADLAHDEGLRRVLGTIGRCDVMFHFGAKLPLAADQTEPGALTPYLATNVMATAILLETAASWGVQRFVFASSLPVIGKPELLPVAENHPVQPQHPYLLSKYQAELACEFLRRMGRVSVTSLRISSPYGPGMHRDTVLPLFTRRALESSDIQIYGSGARTQNFVHVSDVVRAALQAAETGEPGVYNVAGSHSTSMLELADSVVAAVHGSTSRVVFAGHPDPQEDYRWEIDISRSASCLGFRPEIGLAAGLADYVTWLRRGAPGPRWWLPCA